MVKLKNNNVQELFPPAQIYEVTYKCHMKDFTTNRLLK